MQVMLNVSIDPNRLDHLRATLRYKDKSLGISGLETVADARGWAYTLLLGNGYTPARADWYFVSPNNLAHDFEEPKPSYSKLITALSDAGLDVKQGDTVKIMPKSVSAYSDLRSAPGTAHIDSEMRMTSVILSD